MGTLDAVELMHLQISTGQKVSKKTLHLSLYAYICFGDVMSERISAFLFSQECKKRIRVWPGKKLVSSILLVITHHKLEVIQVLIMDLHTKIVL